MTTPDTVEVPRRLIEELAAYLGTAAELSVVVPDNGPWTKGMIDELRREIAGYVGAITALDVAARNAGRTVTLDEIEEACGLPRRQIASDLAAMSKAARRLWGKKVWPMRALQTNAGMNYLMQAEIAEWWLQ
ncbi:MAG: hypothetical protein HY876_08135 [Coriobacteriales bacterium]|nr:hypothetical protein [Coriobacteriales bacterium]